MKHIRWIKKKEILELLTINVLLEFLERSIHVLA